MKEIFTSNRMACAKRCAVNFDAKYGTDVSKQLPFESLYEAYKWAIRLGGIDAAMKHVGFDKVETAMEGDVAIMKCRKTYAFGIVNKGGKTALAQYNTVFLLNKDCTFYRKSNKTL